jgi:hypothetical protein
MGRGCDKSPVDAARAAAEEKAVAVQAIQASIRGPKKRSPPGLGERLRFRNLALGREDTLLEPLGGSHVTAVLAAGHQEPSRRNAGVGLREAEDGVVVAQVVTGDSDGRVFHRHYDEADAMSEWGPGEAEYNLRQLRLAGKALDGYLAGHRRVGGSREPRRQPGRRKCGAPRRRTANGRTSGPRQKNVPLRATEPTSR